MRHLPLLALAAPLLAGCPSESASPCPEGQVLDLPDQDDLGCVPAACGEAPYRGEDGVHVAPWGDDGGDGSADDPLRRLRDAADVAAEAAGGTVLAAAGTYVDNLTLDDHDGVALIGRCSALTAMDCSTEEEPCARVTSGDVDVRGFTLSDAGFPALILSAGPGPELRFRGSDLLIEGSVGGGIILDRARATAELDDVLIRRPLPDGAAFGYGIAVQRGAGLTARGLRIEEAWSRALLIWEGRAEITGAEFRDTRFLPVEGGLAIDVRSAGSLVATDVLMSGSAGIGLLVRDGSAATLTAARCRTPPPPRTGARRVVASRSSEGPRSPQPGSWSSAIATTGSSSPARAPRPRCPTASSGTRGPGTAASTGAASTSRKVPRSSARV
jgi:hypothetical protein